jgi:hypothetical protein
MLMLARRSRRIQWAEPRQDRALECARLARASTIWPFQKSLPVRSSQTGLSNTVLAGSLTLVFAEAALAKAPLAREGLMEARVTAFWLRLGMYFSSFQ